MHIKADLHTHTIASGHAYSTVQEMAQAASSKGLEALAITDHSLNFPGGPHQYYFENISAIPGNLAGVEILKGVEANIVNTDGEIDMPDYLLRSLDLVVAGFHEKCGYESSTVEENTTAMLNALSKPYVYFISHPGNPKFPVNLEKLAFTAHKLGKAIEVNNSSFLRSRPGSVSRCKQLLEYAKKYQTLLVINSDAHIFTAVGEVNAAIEAVEQAGITSEQVLNASVERLHNYLNKHKNRLISILA
ncbi:phosphatase [Bacillota bacterium LX-D]|nr:phosphatase [Bacillota bacterium LX-D]